MISGRVFLTLMFGFRRVPMKDQLESIELRNSLPKEALLRMLSRNIDELEERKQALLQIKEKIALLERNKEDLVESDYERIKIKFMLEKRATDTKRLTALDIMSKLIFMMTRITQGHPERS